MTGDGSDTTLTLTSAPVNENATVVTIDGVVQHKDTYSVSSNTLTFSTAPPTGTAVECITWTNTAINSALLMQDADGDTQIQVEESSDEDKIRFDTAGTERMVIDSTGIDVTGVITTDGLTTSADINFGDDDKAIFGAGSDLQIYHDGSNSYVSDTGTGNLILRGASQIRLENDSGTQMVSMDSGGAAKLYHNGVKRLDTTATGIDVTGTVDADKLSIDTGAINVTIDSGGIYNSLNTTGVTYVVSDTNAAAGLFAYGTAHATKPSTVEIKAGGSVRATIDSTGNVGIGTVPTELSANATTLNVKGGVTTKGGVLLLESSDESVRSYIYPVSTGTQIGTLTNHDLLLMTNSAERMRIDSSGKVGINVSSITDQLEINGGAEYPHIRLRSSNNTSRYMRLGMTDATTHTIEANGASAVLNFKTAGTERLRIDSSGNLLVGTTDTTLYSATSGGGVLLDPNGPTTIARSAGAALYINRTTSDGAILEFRKDGATVGSINSRGGEFIAVGAGDTFLEFNFGSNQINPSSGTSFRDAAINLGASSARFNDIYATNGTIQTSDRNEKQDIAELTDAETRVAVAAKGLLRKFRWIDLLLKKKVMMLEPILES
jgi:hypothetical protein